MELSKLEFSTRITNSCRHHRCGWLLESVVILTVWSDVWAADNSVSSCDTRSFADMLYTCTPDCWQLPCQFPTQRSPDLVWRCLQGCCPVSERLAKQLSKKISASFELTGKSQWENFCLANRSLTGHGRGLSVTNVSIDNGLSALQHQLTMSLISPHIWRCSIANISLQRTTTTTLRLIFRDHPGEPVPEENFWSLWCKGRLRGANTPTIRLGTQCNMLFLWYMLHL